MPFRFIRTGHKPVDQKIYADDGEGAANRLRNCFEPCKLDVRQRLERWIESGELIIKFEFADHEIEVQRL